jgi:hypothetical protein
LSGLGFDGKPRLDPNLRGIFVLVFRFAGDAEILILFWLVAALVVPCV